MGEVSWRCDACGWQDNAPASDDCHQCGRPRGSGPTSAVPRPKSVLNKGRIAALILVFGGGFIGYRVWDNLDRLGISTAHSWEVTGHTWSRTIGITESGEWSEATWCSRMRTEFPGARDIHREVRSTGSIEEVKVGERCKPNQPLEPCFPITEKREVTDDWCTFTWEGDKEVRVVEASENDRSPEWPIVQLSGVEQEGLRRGTFTVTLSRDGGTTRCSLDESVWVGMAPGSRWIGEQSVRHGTLDCTSLRPE